MPAVLHREALPAWFAAHGAGLRHLWLSPHPDDAALSAGALIADQSAAAEPVAILTACCRPQSLERDAAEDAAAAAALGATALWLDEPEAPSRSPSPHRGLRRRLGDALRVLAGGYPGPPTSDTLPERLAATLERLLAVCPQTVVYAPLAIGDHPDHHALRRAAAALGCRLRWYEDLPYAAAGGWPAPTDAQPERIPVQHAAAGEAAVAAYASQHAVLGGLPALGRRLDGYRRQIGGGTPAVRLWDRLAASPIPATLTT